MGETLKSQIGPEPSEDNYEDCDSGQTLRYSSPLERRYSTSSYRSCLFGSDDLATDDMRERQDTFQEQLRHLTELGQTLGGEVTRLGCDIKVLQEDKERVSASLHSAHKEMKQAVALFAGGQAD